MYWITFTYRYYDHNAIERVATTLKARSTEADAALPAGGIQAVMTACEMKWSPSHQGEHLPWEGLPPAKSTSARAEIWRDALSA